MDETVKIYTPKKEIVRVVEEHKEHNAELKKPRVEKLKNDSKWKSRSDSLMEVFKDREKHEELLNWRYPGFNLIYNWVIALLVVALFVSFGIWGMDIRTERKAAVLTATAMADYQAEQQAIENARQAELAAIAASEETIIRQESEWCAKVIYGIKNFIEKYHYSEEDLVTYLRCIFNRVENQTNGFKGLDTIEDIVNQKEQWVGYYSNNPVLSEYYKVAHSAVSDWHNETTKPVSNDFLWAELTQNGIWLKNDFNADGYARRWHYSK